MAKKRSGFSGFTDTYAQKGYGAAWAALIIRQVMRDGGKEAGGKAFRQLTEMHRPAARCAKRPKVR